MLWETEVLTHELGQTMSIVCHLFRVQLRLALEVEGFVDILVDLTLGVDMEIGRLRSAQSREDSTSVHRR